MRFIKKLLGKPEPVPTWDIKPPSQRPASRDNEPEEEVLQVSPEVDPIKEIKEKPAEEKNPWLDDEMLDTIQMEVDEFEDDVYQTSTWEQEFDNDTRKLKTIAIGTKTEKKSGEQFNPYDTGSNRRGWKK